MSIEQERADFEAFASKHGLCVTEDGDLYRSHVVAWMWKAWQARAAIEADRKRRGEPVAWQHRFRMMPDGDWNEWKEGRAPKLRGDSYGVQERPLFTALQPTEPTIKDSLTVAEPVAWLRNERDGYAGKEIFDPLVILGSAPPIKTANGATYSPVFAAPQPAKPVKKKPYAQGTALGEFGVIPMCDQVNDEPVKCIGCEGKPAPENNPCAVCGKEADPVKSHLKVSYDDKGDCLYVVCDSNEPADAEENEQGVLLRRAISDGRLVGVTIMNFMGRHAESSADAQRPAEPVKVPSDDQWQTLIGWLDRRRHYPTVQITGKVAGDIADLLARYGKGTP